MNGAGIPYSNDYLLSPPKALKVVRARNRRLYVTVHVAAIVALVVVLAAVALVVWTNVPTTVTIKQKPVEIHSFLQNYSYAYRLLEVGGCIDSGNFTVGAVVAATFDFSGVTGLTANYSLSVGQLVLGSGTFYDVGVSERLPSPATLKFIASGYPFAVCFISDSLVGLGWNGTADMTLPSVSIGFSWTEPAWQAGWF